ncbi:MAG: hypothetical protein GF411_08480 [Candidatus Lokiarchaeota archaeon]|nr:hypothetical protein [Candidatus Lokiarchaeota archaeon]
MKIIEGLKKLKVLEKRINKNCEDITKYASVLSTEKPAFETEAKQKEEVKKLVQSSEDLANEYLKLKGQIEKTNLQVSATIKGRTHSLSEFLVIKRKLARIMQRVYTALDTSAAENRSHTMRFAPDQKVNIIQLYDEAERNDKLREWQELYEEIDSRLEVINATEDLIE